MPYLPSSPLYPSINPHHRGPVLPDAYKKRKPDVAGDTRDERAYDDGDNYRDNKAKTQDKNKAQKITPSAWLKEAPEGWLEPK